MSNQQVSYIPADTHASMALSGTQRRICPAAAYLASLQSRRSQITMASYFSVAAKVMGREAGIHVESFRDFDWTTLNRTKIQALMVLLSQSGRAPSTVNTYLYGLRGIVREAWSLGYVSHEHYAHCQNIKALRGSRLTRRKVLAAEDLDELLNVCSSDTSEIGVRDYAIFHLMLAAGLRRAEVVTLDLNDFKPNRSEMHISGKGNKERLAHIPIETVELLEYWIEQVRGDDDGPLFCRIRKSGQITGSRLSEQAIYYLLEKRCMEAGMELFKPHDLRATFATMMIEDGADLIVVRDAMGHESVETTERYIVQDASRRRKAADTQGARLGRRNRPLTKVQ